jgi:heme/copper-type cytochrome/quinol oxidase subunit 2
VDKNFFLGLVGIILFMIGLVLYSMLKLRGQNKEYKNNSLESYTSHNIYYNRLFTNISILNMILGIGIMTYSLFSALLGSIIMLFSLLPASRIVFVYFSSKQ